MTPLLQSIAEIEALCRKRVKQESYYEACAMFVDANLLTIKRLAESDGKAASPFAWLDPVDEEYLRPGIAVLVGAEKSDRRTIPLYTHQPQAQAVVTEDALDCACEAWEENYLVEYKFGATGVADNMREAMKASLTAALNAPPTTTEPTAAEVERVARAICAEDGDIDPDHLWRSYVGQARAAIAAMREGK